MNTSESQQLNEIKGLYSLMKRKRSSPFGTGTPLIKNEF